MSEPDFLIRNQYKMVRLIAALKYFNVYLLKDVNTGEKVAAKMQSVGDSSDKVKNIQHEGSYYQELQGHLGIPFLIWCGKQNQTTMVSIFEPLGPTLDDLLTLHQKTTFSMGTTCQVGIRMLQILQNLHEKDYIHQQVNPRSFSLGIGNKSNEIYINDLYFCKRFRSKATRKHIESRVHSNLSDSTPFMSLRQLSYLSTSRRDDLESLIFCLVYFLKGTLPWINPNPMGSSEKKMDWMKQKMNETSEAELCKNLPKQFVQMLNHIRELEFKENPDYALLKRYLNKIMIQREIDATHPFDWVLHPISTSRFKINSISFDLHSQIDQAIEKQYYLPFQKQIELDQFSQFQRPLARTVNSSTLKKNLKAATMQKRDECQLI